MIGTSSQIGNKFSWAGEKTGKLFIAGESTNLSTVLLCLRTVDPSNGKTGVLMKTERFLLAV